MANIIEYAENKGLAWAFRRFILNSLVHWKTTLAGVSAVLGASTLTVNYALDLANQRASFDVHHLGTIAAAWSTGIGLLFAKDAGSHDLAFDEQGNVIPKAEEVQ